MLTVGDTLSETDLGAVDGVEELQLVRIHSDYHRGRWPAVSFSPKDFTFGCPTGIAVFGALGLEFEKGDAAVLGVSTHNECVHLAWRQYHPGLRRLPIPKVSDLRRDLGGTPGILDRSEGVARRASFVVDPEDIIRFVAVNDLASATEVLRSPQAIQAGGLTSCGWQTGDALLVAP